MAARSTPALRRQYTQSGGDLSQARAVVQCVVCREISKGGNYSYYQYKKQEVTRRRCRMCTMRFREQQRVACLSTFGRVVEGIPMQHSVAKGNFAQVMFDIERGVSLAARERATGRTALHEAAACGDIEMCELLLDSGADPNARAWAARETPMHYAAHADEPEILYMLAWFGGNPDLSNKFKQIPLHYCTSREATEALLLFTQRPGALDRNGVSPSVAAREKGLLRVRDTIEESLVEVVIKEQREKVKEEKIARKRADIAAAIRESKIQHEAAQSNVAKAVSDYHKWRAGKEVKYKTKEFQRQQGDPTKRSWAQQHHDKLQKKKQQLAAAEKLKRELATRDRVVLFSASGNSRVANRKLTTSQSKWAKYSKRNTDWKPPPVKQQKGLSLLSQSQRAGSSRTINVGGINYKL